MYLSGGLFFFDDEFKVANLLLESLVVLLDVGSRPDGRLERRLQFQHVLFQLLPLPQCFQTAACLRLEADLYRVQRPLVILAAKRNVHIHF